MIYFNNAATTWPKPEAVYRAVDESFRELHSPLRAVTGTGATPTECMAECRREIAEFLNIPEVSRLIFLPGCTYALNLAILGQPWERGDVAIMSGLEHHSVSRPLRRISREQGVRLEVAPYTVDQPVDLNFIEDVLRRGGVRLVACTMASNVTGDRLPVNEVVQLAHEHGALCLVDAAQAAGVLPVDVETMGADLVSFAGHKGLFGPPGIGGLYVAPHVHLTTLAEGGTGKDSGKHEMSSSFPSAYEVGTHNLPAIVGLAAGVRWIKETGLQQIHEHERSLVQRLVNGLEKLDGFMLYGSRCNSCTSVVSLTIERAKPQHVSKQLAHSHNVVTRPGYHCAPLAHETIGTLPGDGTLRLSPGYFNTEEEVDTVLGCLGEV